MDGGPTSAYPLLLPRQDPRSIDDTDALQDGVWHLSTHEPGAERKRQKVGGTEGGGKESKSIKEKERET